MRFISKLGLLRNRGGPPLFIWVPALCIALLLLVSPLYLLIRSTGAGMLGLDLLFRIKVLEILLRTILLVGSVTLFSSIIAIPLAWLQVRTDLYGSRFWSVSTSLPLVIPTYVGGFVVIVALGPRGMLQGFLEGLVGLERIPNINGFFGACFLLTILSFPYVLLPVRSGLSRLDQRLEESSRNLGSGAITTFVKVTLPLLRPSIASGALLVALYTLSDFGAVSLLRYETFTWAIFSQYEGSLNRYFGALLSTVLMIIALTLVISEGFFRGRGRYYRSDQGIRMPPKVIPLGRWQWVGQLYCALITSLGLILPCGVLLYWLVRGVLAGEPLLLMWQLAWNSAMISAGAAMVTVLAGLPIAVLSVRYSGMLSSLLERITYIGFALPGIVVALGMVFFAARYLPWIYQTFWILIIAYMVLFLPAAVGTSRAALLQIHPDLENSARSLGRGQMSVIWSITLPLVRSGLIAGFAIVFLLTMKELPATLILSPLGFKTLSTAVWSASSEAFFARAAAPALLLILVSSVPLAILTLRGDTDRQYS